MAGTPPGRRPVWLSGLAFGAAVLAAVAGFVVYSHNQRGLGLMVFMIPVVLGIATVAVVCVATVSRGRGRAAWAGLVVAWIATLIVGVLALVLLTTEPWDPPDVAWAALSVGEAAHIDPLSWPSLAAWQNDPLNPLGPGPLTGTGVSTGP